MQRYLQFTHNSGMEKLMGSVRFHQLIKESDPLPSSPVGSIGFNLFIKMQLGHRMRQIYRIHFILQREAAYRIHRIHVTRKRQLGHQIWPIPSTPLAIASIFLSLSSFTIGSNLFAPHSWAIGSTTLPPVTRTSGSLSSLLSRMIGSYLTRLATCSKESDLPFHHTPP